MFILVLCHVLDIDECIEGSHDCDSSTEMCVNLVGSYSCQCVDGFQLNGQTCEGKKHLLP